MTDDEALRKVQEEVNRLSLTTGYIGYCTGCGQDRKLILHSSVADLTSECVDCYEKRRLNEVFTVEDMKKQRSDQVRKYFATRKEKS